MSNSRRMLALMTGFLGLIVLTVGCSSNAEGQSEGRRRPNGGQWARQGLGNWGAEEVVPVEVARPFRADLESFVFGNANIEALRDVEIIARVNGQLETLPVEEGDLVRQGQVLAELEKSELKLNLQEVSARRENNRSIYDRSRKMLEQELTSQELVDKSKYDFETAQTQYERAKLNLEYAAITAPFTGIITSRLVDRGDMIRVNTVLFKLADTEKLLIRLFVPEKDMARIQLANKARIECEMLPGRMFSGLVDMISPIVDAATGTIKVTVRVTEGTGSLKPGMFCSVYILIETHQDALVISRRALIPETEVPEVFVVDDSAVVHRKRLTLGISQGDTLEVLKGLSESDQVVVIGQENIHEGSRTRISFAGADSTAAEVPAAPQAQPDWKNKTGGKAGAWRKPQ